MNEQNEVDSMVKASREKYWEECTDSQKIERLRDELVRCNRTLESALKVINMLKEHNHAENGMVTVYAFHRVENEERPFGYRGSMRSLQTEFERR